MGQAQTMLVVGSTGFIGAHLRTAAAEAGWSVVGTSRSGAGGDLACDLADPESVERAVASAAPDSIVAAAGDPSVARAWERPAGTADVHALGILRLLEAARRRAPDAHLICLSSAEVYGSSPDPMDEDDPVLPLTPYGAAKAAMETFCAQQARAHGMRIAVLRLFNQIGPGLAPGHAIADFAAAVAAAEQRGEPVVRLRAGNPGAVRDYTDVRDCASALVAVAGAGAEGTFNLCSGRPVTVRDLVAELDRAAAAQVGFEVDPALARPADPAAKLGRPDRLAEAVGWRARIPLPVTVADMLAGARGSASGAA